MRFRNISMIIGTIATMALVFLSDPDLGPGMNMLFGTNTLLLVKSVVALSLACLVLHLSRKTLLDYINVEAFFKKALETSDGAGKAIIGIGVILLAFSVIFAVISFKV